MPEMVQLLIQAGALGLLAVVLWWTARNQEQQRRDFNRALDNKDEYVRQLVSQTMDVNAKTRAVLDRMISNLSARRCPMVAEDVLREHES